jgi:hypothetical protein
MGDEGALERGPAKPHNSAGTIFACAATFVVPIMAAPLPAGTVVHL